MTFLLQHHIYTYIIILEWKLVKQKTVSNVSTLKKSLNITCLVFLML